MKLFDILKQQGLFSNDIKLRIKNNQITINSEVIKDNIELDIELDNNGLAIIHNADDFLFWTLKNSKIDNIIIKLKIFGFENLFGSNIKNELTDILNEFLFIRTSKKEIFLLKKAKCLD